MDTCHGGAISYTVTTKYLQGGYAILAPSDRLLSATTVDTPRAKTKGSFTANAIRTVLGRRQSLGANLYFFQFATVD